MLETRWSVYSYIGITFIYNVYVIIGIRFVPSLGHIIIHATFQPQHVVCSYSYLIDRLSQGRP